MSMALTTGGSRHHTILAQEIARTSTPASILSLARLAPEQDDFLPLVLVEDC